MPLTPSAEHPNVAEPTTSQRLHLRIRGRVQGVFFRATVQRRAREIGIDGWVRNCSDGTVELVAEGPEPTCCDLLDFCWDGPPAARVEDIEVEWEEPTGEHSGFAVRR